MFDSQTPRRHPLGLPDPQNRPDFYQGVLLRRGVAWVLDIGLIAVLAVLFLPFTAFAAIFFFPFFISVVGFFYRWGTIALGSATWGMALTGIELRESDGLTLSGTTAFWHTLGYTLAMLIFPLQLVSVLLMLLNARRQGLVDLALGTAAINRAL